ncbi:hypothetical protein [Serratia fonticola]|uniref:hypothetical protein n=1 Tax=Serratia fonticola TaxID=47917 RepID=UPI0027FD3814|nr:hypothetical protein [Serratia fonticola]MDQ7207376.1 hypothetical protein [Serratia fonticola]HBE9077610.1 hypothetical protein [Serratia fonticola]HBE9088181.1 hypothetical protein [Serratia fonticola]HBE9150339.1 hypothetical protein [Serratia fonticola]
MASIVPFSGKAISLRNKRTGASWVASFDFTRSVYRFEPCGNLKAIREAFEAPGIPQYFELAGTH